MQFATLTGLAWDCLAHSLMLWSTAQSASHQRHAEILTRSGSIPECSKVIIIALP